MAFYAFVVEKTEIKRSQVRLQVYAIFKKKIVDCLSLLTEAIEEQYSKLLTRLQRDLLPGRKLALRRAGLLPTDPDALDVEKPLSFENTELWRQRRNC